MRQYTAQIYGRRYLLLTRNHQINSNHGFAYTFPDFLSLDSSAIRTLNWTIRRLCFRHTVCRVARLPDVVLWQRARLLHGCSNCARANGLNLPRIRK